MNTPIAQKKEIQERRKKALDLRLAGATFREIAGALGVSLGTAHTDVATALADIPKEEANELRKLEAARLDALNQAHWENALNGDTNSAKIVLSVIDRRIKLLGLDMPQRVEIAGNQDLDLDTVVDNLIGIAEATVRAELEAEMGDTPDAGVNL